MAALPSYQDAVSRLDWLQLVASYVGDKDLASLCSVNRRFYALFAPRLWSDPLVVVRRLGLHPGDDLEWYLAFVLDRMQRLRQSTLALITTFDFRDFAKDTAHFSSDNTSRTIPETLRRLPTILPNLRCILLDGHVEADPAFLIATPPLEAGAITTPSRGSQGVLALSLAHCQTQLPNGFFSSDRVQHLVYLDVSGLPGSLQPLVAAASGRRNLGRLKILKARRREVNDALALSLFEAFKSSLWSLDIGQNNITDGVLNQFVTHCFTSPPLRSQSRFATEGRLVFDGQGNDAYGQFVYIEESDWSDTFRHPERHFVDAPAYCADAGRVLQEEEEAVRTNGRTPLRRDSVDYVKAAIAGSVDQTAPEWSDMPYLDVCTAPAGITHLHLSDNRVTSSGLERLVRTSHGQLEELSCDSLLFQPVHRSSAKQQHLPWPSNMKLRGALGCAYVFRPVLSSNLRVLRIHHSLVTQIPTLETDGLSTLARLWLAETSIRERSEMAFPAAFEPDTNPRLTSLTLTNIPRRSNGPLIDKLLHFLTLAGLQEHAIQATAHSSSRRSPVLLRGLRHICLEFEADPIEDPAGFSTVEDLDAEGLLSMDEEEAFSFFAGERPRPRASAEAATKKKATDGRGFLVRPHEATAGSPAGLRRSEIDGEYMRYSDTWGQQQTDRKVWVGPGVPGANPAINEYMKLAMRPPLRSRVGPASPAHVRAGVPTGALLFHAAWDAIVMPRELRPPRRAELDGMRDVLEAVKSFRAETRAGCEAAKGQAAVGGMAEPTRPRRFFWTGRLEVSAQQSMAHYRAPGYWR
ncbi:hypothetical protein LX36DRAFT_713942 [Colletotrichum falcatum]|nr:hypothetical protein LX36DRAFT_713942 [Colletotrichum falcatum]